jgi:hypothetical protein
MIFLLFILFFFFEKYYLIKNRPYGYNIENNILLGVKESSDPRFYKELHKLLIERDYKKLEECLRASYSNLECLGSKSNLISNLEYDSFIDDFMKKNIYFNNQSTNDIYIDIKKSGIEDFMLKDNFSEWQRENNVLSRRFFYTGYNLGERLRYPPFVKEINGDISKISKKIINVLAVSDSFGEGAGNFDSDINWIAILESKLNKIDSEYHFNFIKLSNIGANYNDYHRWFLDGKIKEDYFDIVLLSLNYSDLRTFGETSDKFSYIPKESIMFLNCLDRENIVFDSFINRFLPNITLAIKSNRCLANYDKHFINIGDKNNANYLDYNEMLYNYKNIVNSTNLDIFIFDLAFNISNNNVSFQDYYGDLKISDFYRTLGGFGFLFFDNYKNIDAINNNIKRCNFSSCHLFSNFKDTHYSAVTLNSIIDANLYKIREKLVSSFISKNNKVGYKKSEMVKQFIIEDNYLIGVLKKDYNNISKYIYSTNFTEDSSTITLDHALCASLGREHIRIPIKRYDAENKVFSIKFDFFQEDLLLAIGGYDSLGNQVISKFQKIRNNVTYKFSGGEESRIIIIAKESLGCNEGSWRLADFAFTLEK